MRKRKGGKTTYKSITTTDHIPQFREPFFSLRGTERLGHLFEFGVVFGFFGVGCSGRLAAAEPAIAVCCQYGAHGSGVKVIAESWGEEGAKGVLTYRWRSIYRVF